MDHFLYTAASGARETMLAQAVNASNIANASTTGFRANLVMARSAYLSGAGHDSRVYAATRNEGVDFTQGTLNPTGRDLDVAINGHGWMAVDTGNGEETYSRRGDLRVTELGQLVNGAGEQVIGRSGPIALPPSTSISIGADGTISIVGEGEEPSSLTAVDQIKLVNPEGAEMYKGLDGRMRLKSGEDAAVDPEVVLVAGSLESSNVNNVEAMVRMIELSRQFEHHVKMMGTAEDMDRSSAELMSMS